MSLSRSSSAFRIASNPAPGANIVGVRMPPRSPRPSLATTSRRQVAARSYSRAGESSSRRAILGLQVPSRSQDGVHGRTFVSGITTSPGQSQRAHLAPPRLSLTAAQPRHFSSTSSTHAAAQPHTNTPTLLASPSEPEDPDIFSAGPDPSVLLTDRAVAQLHKIAVKEKDEEKRAKLCFRIGVEPGGCHGYQYKMELSRRGQEGKEEEEGDDFLFQPALPESAPDAEVAPIPVAIDSISLNLLKGSTIDYVTELIGSQFAIKDNPQAKGAGCGCGVSWEPVA